MTTQFIMECFTLYLRWPSAHYVTYGLTTIVQVKYFLSFIFLHTTFRVKLSVPYSTCPSVEVQPSVIVVGMGISRNPYLNAMLSWLSPRDTTENQPSLSVSIIIAFILGFFFFFPKKTTPWTTRAEEQKSLALNAFQTWLQMLIPTAISLSGTECNTIWKAVKKLTELACHWKLTGMIRLIL